MLTRSRTCVRRALCTAIGGLLLIAGGIAAQTPEGTTITNQADVSWTDANGNTYTPVSASIAVTVGFAAGVDASSPASASPTPGSTGNVITFTLSNLGNGTDSLAVSESITGSGITVTGYDFNTVTYADLASLNVALAAAGISAGGSITVDVVYDAGAGSGGSSIDYTLTATSRRDGSVQDAATTTITPTQAAGVTVTPDGGAANRLPSNGTDYTETFTVTNTGNGADSFDLLASANATKITIVSVNGVAGSSTQIALNSGASTSIDVIYTVLAVAAGTTDVLQLLATSVADVGVSDPGTVTVTVVAPALSVLKEAFRDDKTTPIGAGTVLPGEFIQYRITVTNTGTADASSVDVTDTLPAQVTLDSTSDDGGSSPAWTITTTGQVQGTLTTLAAGASRFFWIRVQIN